MVGITPPGFFGDTLRSTPPDFFLPLNMEPYIQSDPIDGRAPSAILNDVRLLGNQLYGINPYNPVVALAAVAAPGFSTLLASIVPAIRASLISPLNALRAE